MWKPGEPKRKREAINGGLPTVTKVEALKLLHRRDAKNFKLPPGFEKMDLSTVEFLAWKHPSGHRGYILENETGTPRIWVLECETKSTNSKPAMCSLCCTVKSGSGTKMFSYRPDNNRNKIVGFYLCSDLNCVENVTAVNPNSMRETITPDEKRQRMLSNLHGIVLTWEEANNV